ncbi:F-box DNA helicase 1-like [Asterias rubens]|uniref:F-box DNA helicase 1-like n=1 Tax=Asterias rubens TaxID=7604 RepID=UPI001454F34C|nr:F-box DNA helicase 1-like [Asterias rubens]XP_033646867.1 F-box DNA helicase 1-like [Asterias rubens]
MKPPSTEMEYSNSSNKGNRDDGAMSKRTQCCPGSAPSSQDTSSVLSDDGIDEHKLERCGGSEVQVSAEPLPVSSCQSSQGSSGHHQEEKLIESGFQTENKKQECISNPHMFECSQGTEEEDNKSILWPSEILRVTNQLQSGHVGKYGEMKLEPLSMSTHPQEKYTPISSQSQVPQLSTNAAGVKRKHLRMNSTDCAEHAQTAQGSMALTNPAAVKTSSKDVNRGLYPRPAVPRTSSHHQTAASRPSAIKRLCSPSKIRLSPEQMKNQSRIHQYFPASPPKTELSVKQNIAQAGSSPGMSKSPMSQGVSGNSPIPRKNFNSQFMTMGPVSPQRLSSSTFGKSLPTGGSPPQRSSQSLPPRTPTKLYLNHNHFSNPAAENMRSPTLSPRQAANGARESPKSWSRQPSNSPNQPLLPSSQERTPTKTFLYSKPKQSPSPSKSEKSTVDSDIEDFHNDTSFDGLNFGGILPKPVSIQLSSSTNLKSGKNTLESDINNFNNDTTFDSLNFDADVVAPDLSQGLSSQDDSGLDAFEKDSFFDSVDPEMLSANSESISSLPSSQTEYNPRNTFGLLGEGFSDDETLASGFACLPIEVLQRIFCFVPLMDLCRHLSCICKLWNEIISKEEFLPWKKHYHRVRLKVKIDRSDLVNLLTKQEQASGAESQCMLDLVRNMPNFQARFGTSMDRDLQKHPKYGLAKDIIKDRAPELLQNDTPNPWSIVALLVILSETVHDVFFILRCLLHPTATCTTMELLECLYCIASHLWIYQRLFRHNIGWHYRVYYTLYLFENSQLPIYLTPDGSARDEGKVRPSSVKSQRVPFTHEQCRILNHDVKRGEVVKIQAFAGTGKTTMLVEYAKQRPNMSFLYVAFNKSVQKHAEEVFSRNVTSSTMHSLAYKAIGWRFKDKIIPAFKPFLINKLISSRGNSTNRQQHGGMHWMRYSKMVCKTLNNYCASADNSLTSSHVPEEYMTYEHTAQGIVALTNEISHSIRMNIATSAATVWSGIKKPKNKEAVITHDVYLKLYQLSKPWNLNYDCLLIDEAQDLTPAQQDILMNQRSAKILVGDNHQQIYGFRGATNAMSRVVSQHTFHLTQSFRFGPGIAYIADCVLERSSSKVRHILVGKMEQDHIDGEELGQVAIITRTNVILFREAVNIVKADTTTMIGFAGGIDGYGMDLILDIYQLKLPQSERRVIKSQLVKYHKSIGSLKAYASQTEEVGLLNKIRIVEQYNIQIPELIKLIKSRTRHESLAAFVLSTVHKSKGLEFDTVKITDDFAIKSCRQNALGIIQADELNMVYVALTRAKKSLVLNSSFLEFLSQRPAKEKFMYPVPAKSSGDEKPQTCVECQQTVPNKTVVLLKIKDFQLAYPTSRRRGAGVICPQCSLESFPSFECFHKLDEDQEQS